MDQNDLEFASGKTNTRKEWIDNMIAESKKRKADRQRDLEEARKITVDLDQEWKNMRNDKGCKGLMKEPKKFLLDEADEAKKDPYDILLRELGFEKGKKEAQDRLLTEEEKIKEEKEKLEKLEADRLKRMRGEVENEEEEAEEEVESDDEEEEGDEEEESDDDDEEDMSDLEESEDEEEQKGSKKKVKVIKCIKKSPLDMEKIREEAEKQIPFAFTAPTTYDELTSHFIDRSPTDHGIIVGRIVKCNHPQFGNNNKEKMETLFTFLLQYIHDCAVDYDPEEEDCDSHLATIDVLMPLLYDLAQFSPAPSAKAVLSVLQEKYEEYKKHPRAALTFETVRIFEWLKKIFKKGAALIA